MNDKRFIFRAAAHAQRVINFLHKCQTDHCEAAAKGGLSIFKCVFSLFSQPAADVWARPGVLVLLNQVGEGLVHESLKLAAFLVGELVHGREDFRIDLGGEFIAV